MGRRRRRRSEALISSLVRDFQALFHSFSPAGAFPSDSAGAASAGASLSEPAAEPSSAGASIPSAGAASAGASIVSAGGAETPSRTERPGIEDMYESVSEDRKKIAAAPEVSLPRKVWAPRPPKTVLLPAQPYDAHTPDPYPTCRRMTKTMTP